MPVDPKATGQSKRFRDTDQLRLLQRLAHARDQAMATVNTIDTIHRSLIDSLNDAPALPGPELPLAPGTDGTTFVAHVIGRFGQAQNEADREAVRDLVKNAPSVGCLNEAEANALIALMESFR